MASLGLKVGAIALVLGMSLVDAMAEPIKFARFEVKGAVSYGIVLDDRIETIDGNPFDGYTRTGETHPLESVRLLVPCEPTKILGAAGNMLPVGSDPKPKPDHPELFLKSVSALVPQNGEIVIPRGAERVLYEGEVVAVIGKRARKVSVEEASDYILGITCGNDVSGGDWGNDFQAWRVKATDTFAPCGPFLVTGLDYNRLEFELRLNGETRQKTNTSKLIHSIPELVSFISQYITLEPGDLIYSGTQPPIDVLKPGDVVEVEVEGVGILSNRVVADTD